MEVQENEALSPMTAPGISPPAKTDWRLLLASGLLLSVWNVIAWRFPFFWDTVLTSKIAHWYLETGFSQLTVPEHLDAGHPPFFSLYIAGAWRMFGRSLSVAHMAMLPFLGLFLVQFLRMARRSLSPRGSWWAMALLFCDPTFLAQSSMVSADIALLALFFWGLNALLDGQRGAAAVAMTLMASMNFRGILMVPVLFAIEAAVAWMDGKRQLNWRAIIAYLPVAAMTLLWLWVHYRAVGWLLSPPPETYGGQREVVGLLGMARNAGVLAWRLLDFGRIAVFGMAVLGILKLGPRKIWEAVPLRRLLLALLLFVVLLGLCFVPFSNPIGHRYFLVAYGLLILSVVQLAELDDWHRKWKWGLVATMIFLASGNLWVYPKGVAQGWDGSLAHLPIFELQRELHARLAAEKIDPNQVCGDFPLLANRYYTEVLPLNEGKAFRNFLETQDYQWVVVSRLNNGYSDAQRIDFETSGKWVLRMGTAFGAIDLRLYERRLP